MEKENRFKGIFLGLAVARGIEPQSGGYSARAIELQWKAVIEYMQNDDNGGGYFSERFSALYENNKADFENFCYSKVQNQESDAHRQYAEFLWKNNAHNYTPRECVARIAPLVLMTIGNIEIGKVPDFNPSYYGLAKNICRESCFDPRCTISCWTLFYVIQHVIALRGTADFQRIKVNCFRTMRLMIGTMPSNSMPATFTHPHEIINDLGAYFNKHPRQIKCEDTGAYIPMIWALWMLDLLIAFEEGGQGDLDTNSIIAALRNSGDVCAAAAAGAVLGAYIGWDKAAAYLEDLDLVEQATAVIYKYN